jgi:O-antigen ligase
MAGIGIVATLLLSMAFRFTSRKALIALSCALLAAAVIPIVQVTMERRLAAQGISFLSADKERQAFERAARAMMAAKPMGVGPNHYVFVANTEGYNSKAGVNWSFGNRSANVHNSYLMVGAETGWLGLVTMVLLLGSAIATAFLSAWKYRRHPSADMLIGVGCGLLAVAAHGFLEWMFVILPAQYLLAASFGIIAGLRLRLVSGAAQARRRTERPTRYVENFSPLPAGASKVTS